MSLIDWVLKIQRWFLPREIDYFNKKIYKQLKSITVSRYYRTLISRYSVQQCFPTLFLAAHQHCVFSLSPYNLKHT